MIDIISRVFPISYQIISIKLIFAFFIIFFEISLSQINFFYQATPLILFIFLFFWFVEIGMLPYWVYFIIGLFFDFLNGYNLGFITLSTLVALGILSFLNINAISLSYFKKILVFSIMILVFQSIMALMFFLMFFTFPNIIDLTFQTIFTIIVYPIVMFSFKPIKNLISFVSNQ
jgi:hypothetical protein